ncbi:sensor histidine kinase [Ornithinimicrobium sp. Arc0846-15]|nr:sensor histidine kinase [Ornithinimicrobium laminariae]
MRTTLAQWWREPAVADPPRVATRRDQVVAAVVVVATLLQAVFDPNLAWRPVAVAFGLTLAGLVLIRTRRPLLSVAVAFGGFALLDAMALLMSAEPIVLFAGVVVVLFPYALFRWACVRHAIAGLPFMVAAVAMATLTGSQTGTEAASGAAVLVFFSALGQVVRYRAASRSQMIDHMKLQERQELARELHDSLAHHVSAIAIQAQAGLAVIDAPPQAPARSALLSIETEAAQALAEMRSIVGALRDPTQEAGVTPGRDVAAIQALEQRSTERVNIDVQIIGDVQSASIEVQSALFRIAREGVTNALRHAQGASEVSVVVTSDSSRVELVVGDNGQVPDRFGTGYGLIGMRERAELLGGQFSAGVCKPQGWEVRASFSLAGGQR